MGLQKLRGSCRGWLLVAMGDGLMVVGMREASASVNLSFLPKKTVLGKGNSPSSLILHFLVSVPIIRTFPLHSFSLLVFSDLKIELSMSHNVYNRGFRHHEIGCFDYTSGLLTNVVHGK